MFDPHADALRKLCLAITKGQVLAWALEFATGDEDPVAVAWAGVQRNSAVMGRLLYELGIRMLIRRHDFTCNATDCPACVAGIREKHPTVTIGEVVTAAASRSAT